MNFRILPLVLIALGIFSCIKGSSPSTDIYLGGLIVNPTSKFVVLLKKDVVVDTFYLNNTNRFGGKLPENENGLFVFKHPPENQIVYLEPGDSTLILLNTIEFDESLNFSGKGAAKSNYLNKIYLHNQENNELILSYFELKPQEFAIKSDSILETRKEELNLLNKKHKFSQDFYQLANSAIHYEYYDLRERYAYLLRAFNRKKVDELPEDFHQYRNEISYNDEELDDYYVYLNFLDDLIRTKSLEYCENNREVGKECYDILSYQNIKRRMVLTDSLIKNERIKNPFLEKLAAQGIIYSQSTEDINSVLQLLEEVNYEGNRLQDIKQLASISNSLLPGNSIAELELVNIEGEVVQLQNITNKPIITFHWSVTSQHHHKWQHKIVKDLRKKFPEVEFIGINIDNKNLTEGWKKAIVNNSYRAEDEFQLNRIRINEDLLKNFQNRMLFVEPSGKIVKGDTRFDTPNFETKIEEFIVNRR